VGWITAAQKVTLASGDDADVHGWAGGVLVSLAVRDGRLGEWRQRSCSAAGAATLLAVTPAPWAPFARRNAELAARLAASSHDRGR
jgi:excinuclease ABC subunit C